MKKRIIELVLLLCLMGLFSGCAEKEKPGDQENMYHVYCTNSTASKLLNKDYYMNKDTTEAEAQVWELLDAMRVSEPELSRHSAIPEDVQIQSIKLDARLLTITFDSNYMSMTPSREIICRAAVVKTVSQVEGVEYVSFIIGEKPLIDAKGETVEMMQAKDFLESSSSAGDTMEPITLILYFTNKTGDKLIETERTVLYDGEAAVERLVLNQLIEGPSGEGTYATLPSSLKVLGMRVKDGVCYINLDNTFIDKAKDVADYIPIYSIVNSLSELAGINRVQISINGSGELMFRETISLNQQFERNLDYIGGMED